MYYLFLYNVIKTNTRDNLNMVYSNANSCNSSTWKYYSISFLIYKIIYYHTLKLQIDQQTITVLITIGKNQLEYFKKEVTGIILLEFMSLHPKWYAFKIRGIVVKKSENVKKLIIEKYLKTHTPDLSYRNMNEFNLVNSMYIPK